MRNRTRRTFIDQEIFLNDKELEYVKNEISKKQEIYLREKTRKSVREIRRLLLEYNKGKQVPDEDFCNLGLKQSITKGDLYYYNRDK